MLAAVAGFAGVVGALRLAAAAKAPASVLLDEEVWRLFVISRLPRRFRDVRHPREALLIGVGLPHKCWRSVLGAEKVNIAETWRSAFASGPAFLFLDSQAKPKVIDSRIEECKEPVAGSLAEHGLTIELLPLAGPLAGRDLLTWGNIRASQGYLYWEIDLERLAPVRLAGVESTPRAWLGVVSAPGAALSDAAGEDGFALFSNGRLVCKNRIVLGAERRPSAGFGEGDVVGMLLDCERSVMAFWVNGGSPVLAAKVDLPLPLTPCVQIEGCRECLLRVGRPVAVAPERAAPLLEAALRRSSAADNTVQRKDDADEGWQCHELVW